MNRRPLIIGHHLIWTLYGHWLPNDPRGSGSTELQRRSLAVLGPIHHGRKPEHLQPSRRQLRDFQRQAAPLLEFSKFWIDDAKRQAIGESFCEVMASQSYTVWACAILSNHVHMAIRRHRDDALTMWHKVADAARLRLRQYEGIDSEHPIWSERPFKVFLRTPEEVRSRIRYVGENPTKENLPPQNYDFVTQYNNWPFQNRKH